MPRRRVHHNKGRITVDRIFPGKVLDAVFDNGAGGTVLFLGTVRNQSEAGRVEELEYDSYREMGEKKLQSIEGDVVRKWPIKRIKILHRVGRLKLGEVSVAVAVSTPHRADAFEACRYAIDRIKAEAPIWKREKLVGGRRVWVAGQTIGG